MAVSQSGSFPKLDYSSDRQYGRSVVIELINPQLCWHRKQEAGHPLKKSGHPTTPADSP